MNIDSGDDIAFHMSVWWNAVVVYNTKEGGCWREEIKHGLFPFKQNELFKVRGERGEGGGEAGA